MSKKKVLGFLALLWIGAGGVKLDIYAIEPVLKYKCTVVFLDIPSKFLEVSLYLSKTQFMLLEPLKT